MNDHAEGDGHAGEDDDHLPFAGNADRLCSADRGVDENEEAGENNGELKVPAEDGGDDDGRRVNGDAGGEPALHQETKTRRAGAFSGRSVARDIRRR